MAVVGYEINWSATAGDPLTRHPLYLKYSSTPLGAIDLPSVKGDLVNCLLDVDSAPVVAYLSWLVRLKGLTA